MAKRPIPIATVRLLEGRREELLAELRAIAPELVRKLEETLAALREQSNCPRQFREGFVFLGNRDFLPFKGDYFV